MADLHVTGHIVGDNYSMEGHGTAGDVAGTLYETPDTQEYPIGTRIVREDGAVFRYGMTAAAITPGKLVSPDLSGSALVDDDNIFSVTAGYNTIGLKSLRIDDAGVSAAVNEWAGATLIITDDTGEGHAYHVKSNTVTASNVTFVELFSPLLVGLDATSDACIVGLPWRELVTATLTDNFPCGVAMASLADNDFGWFQTWGVAAVLCEGAVTINSMVTLGDTIAGAVQVQDAYTEPVVGHSIQAGDDTGYISVMIKLYP
tara:strand:- start:288 stop:1064 length:777 start_codon:yes stop_codon:yes gene_type:complete